MLMLLGQVKAWSIRGMFATFVDFRKAYAHHPPTHADPQTWPGILACQSCNTYQAQFYFVFLVLHGVCTS